MLDHLAAHYGCVSVSPIINRYNILNINEICLAAVPFMACAMVLVALIIMFPGNVSWLPFLTG